MTTKKKLNQKFKRGTFTITEADNDLIEQLSTDHQHVLIRLSSGSSETMEEIAAVAGVPVGTIKSRLHRARMALKALRESP